MSKSVVFISHIGDESEIATEFKALIEDSFLGLIDVFVSSDGTSIGMGQRWLDNISTSLSQCAVEIVICSPVSVTKPWINFEAGAGWVRGIPVIPLCHSGMEPRELPVPLNLLQAAKATDVSGLKLIFPVLASAIGSKVPNIDFTDFIGKVEIFERKYTFWKYCNAAFKQLFSINPGIINALKTGQTVVIDLTESQINILDPHMQFLSQELVLNFSRVGNTKMTTSGVYYDVELKGMGKLGQVLNDPLFNY
jgi:hypothetical protein